MMQRLAGKLSFGSKPLLVAIGVAAVAGPFVYGPIGSPRVHAHSSTADWDKTAGGKMEFDVVSVKQDTATPSEETVHTNVPLGAAAFFSPTGGRFSATNLELYRYMIFAYKLTNEQIQAVQSQLPKWGNTNRYDVEARTAGNPTKDQYRLMMQALLADRFKLAIHYMTKQVPVLALVLDKPGKLGPQLQRHRDDSPCSTAFPGAEVATVEGGFPKACGALAPLPPTASGRVRLGARGVAMTMIAGRFSSSATFGTDRPVLDKTGLTGEFDFIIEFSPEAPPGSNFQPDPNGQTFPEALKEQLGLKLESQTGPVDVLVIAHLEEPSPN